MRKEKELEYAAMTKKGSCCKATTGKKKEQSKTGELSQLLQAVASLQQETVMFQQELNEVMLALKQKQMVNCLREEVQYLHDKELYLNQDLERSLNHALASQDSPLPEAWAAEDGAANLRRKVSTGGKVRFVF